MLKIIRTFLFAIAFTMMLAMLIPSSAHAITLEQPSAPSPVKAVEPRSISNDANLVPDANGVMMYDYGGSTGTVYNPKVVAVEGLRYYHNFQYAGVAKAKDHFLNSADWLVENASAKQGGKYSLWEYDFPWMFYGGIAPPYASALAQAEGAELLAKAYAVTNEEKYLRAAQKAVAAFLVDYDEGGVASLEDDGNSVFLQLVAKPGFKKTYVLNGHTGALLHLWEYYKITNDEVAKDVFEKGVKYLRNNLPQFDAGDWSYYDKMGTLAKESYHKGHIKQLNYLYDITNESILEEYGYKFLLYYDERQGQETRVGEIKEEYDDQQV
jgi:hypothetical protein